MSRLHLDYETYSEVNLKAAGVYKYAESPTTEINCARFALDDGPVDLWLPYDAWDIPQAELLDKLKLDRGAQVFVQKTCPQKLLDYIANPSIQFAAHNAMFERILTEYVGPRYGMPPIPRERWICTMAKARAHSMPGSLGECSEVMDTYPKDESGRMDMLALAKPRTGAVKRYWPWAEPQRWVHLIDYCGDDVRAERDLDHNIPDLTPYEQKVYWFDQKVNDRGWEVDLEAVRALRKLRDEYKKVLVAKCRELTGLTPGQTGALADWIRANGYPTLPNLQKETLVEIIDDPRMPDTVRRVLRIYNLYGMKAVAKFDAILKAVCKDGRLRGLFLYSQAGTGRWSSVIVQLHNLFKSVIADPNKAIDSALAGDDLHTFAAQFDANPMKVLASCIRGVLVAKEGHELNVLDFSAIEGKVTHWLADDQVVLEAYRTHGKVYELAAAQVYGLPLDVESLKRMKAERPAARQGGKITELSMGFGGAVGALTRMIRSENAKLPADKQIEMSEDQKLEAVKGWRAARPRVVNTWWALTKAACNAVANPGVAYPLTVELEDGTEVTVKKVMFRLDGKWLYMRLPSGRRIAYYKPEIQADGSLVCQGNDTFTRRWGETSLWHGKLMENWVQAVARDLLVRGMFELEEAGYTIIGHVHDEAVSEVPIGFGSIEESARIMCPEIPWAFGLPIKAEGYRARRYKKDS